MEGKQWLRRVLPWLPFVLVVATSAAVLFDDLDRPDEIYFDEHYYISVAYQISNGVWEDPCWDGADPDHRPVNFEHPPLAKLILAWSVHWADPDQGVFDGCRQPDGDAYATFTSELRQGGHQEAWRIPPVLFGLMGVTFAGLAAGRMFRSPVVAALAALLTLLDGVYFTSARMAMLDIFVTGFTMAALYAATFVGRRGVVTAAALLALGFACKFTAVFAGPAVFATVLWSHHRAGRLTRRTIDAGLATFAALPVVALFVTSLPWIVRWARRGLGYALGHWFRMEAQAFGYHASFESSHDYASPASRWFLLERPTYYYKAWNVGGVQGAWRYVYAVPNPALWWITALAAGIVATLFLRDAANKRLDLADPLWIALFLPLTVYAGFLTVARESFIFYATLLVPFMAVFLAGALITFARRLPRVGVPTLVVVALLVVRAFLFYLPVLTAGTIDEPTFEHIMGLVPTMRT